MEELFESGWRVVPAAIVAGGLLFAVTGVRRGILRARGRPDPGRALELMLGFRLAVVGLAVAGFGAACLWSIGWMALLSAIIGGEELLESSFVIAAVRNGPEGENAKSNLCRSDSHRELKADRRLRKA